MSFTIKHRGARGLVMAEYRCHHHGVIERLVQRDSNGDPPGFVVCQIEGVNAQCCIAEWTISAPAVHTAFVVTASRGKSDPKPHAKAMDTRPLAEGQKYSEWHKERKKIREEERHQRVRRLLE